MDGDLYFMSMLIMYIPRRSEHELTLGYSSAEEAFKAKLPSALFPDTEFGNRLRWH